MNFRSPSRLVVSPWRKELVVLYSIALLAGTAVGLFNPVISLRMKKAGFSDMVIGAASSLFPTTSEVEIRVFGKPLLPNEADPGEYYEAAGSSENFSVNLEDIDLCERVQEGMQSEYGGVGALARDYEHSIRHFHKKYLSEMFVEKQASITSIPKLKEMKC